jgi:hypothetical protein
LFWSPGKEPATKKAYPNSSAAAKRKKLRRQISALMVRVHRISAELADSYVSEMSDQDLAWRAQMYARLGFAVAVDVAVGARPSGSSPASNQAGRDGVTASEPPKCDSVALPLKGAGGVVSNQPAENDAAGEGAFDVGVFT